MRKHSFLRSGFAILLSVMMLVAVVPVSRVYAAFGTVEIDAILSPATLSKSSSEQIVTLTIAPKNESDFVMDSIEYQIKPNLGVDTVTIDCIGGLSGIDFKNSNIGKHKKTGNYFVSWITTDEDGANITTNQFGKFEITVPANTPAGTYTVEVLGLETTKDYGGDGYRGSAVATLTITEAGPGPGPRFASQSLKLGGQIGVDFYMDLPEIDGVNYADSYMTFSIPHGPVTARAEYDAGKTYETGEKTLYAFSCYINSIQMAEAITATFHYEQNGIEQTVNKTYAAADYFEAFETAIAQGTINVPNEMIDVVYATADFGYYVQPFLSQENNWVYGQDYAAMTTRYTDNYTDQFAAIAAAAATYARTDDISPNSDIAAVTNRLIVDSSTEINVFFTLTAGYSGTFMASVDGGAEEEVLPDANGKYTIKIGDIPAHQLSKEHTITVTTENGTASVTVSALSYVHSVFQYYTDANDTNNYARNAAAAIWYYAQSADAYKAANQNS